jgi:hypothetical protein
MIEPAKTIPWGAVLSNFVWIVGAAIILAAFSYHDFLAQRERKKLKDVLSRNSFKKPLLGGLALVFGGAALSVRSVWISIPLAAVGIYAAFQGLKALHRDRGQEP